MVCRTGLSRAPGHSIGVSSTNTPDLGFASIFIDLLQGHRYPQSCRVVEPSILPSTRGIFLPRRFLDTENMTVASQSHQNGFNGSSNGHKNGTHIPPEDSSSLLWRHPDPESTKMWEFLLLVNKRHGLNLHTYSQLHQWSIDHIASFWGDVWDFVGIRASEPYEQVRLPGPLTQVKISSNLDGSAVALAFA